jgi:hypothetical protein
VATDPDFSRLIVEALAKRSAQTCSNPACHKPTSAPHLEKGRAVVLGEAAHIRGARPTAARFDHNMTDEQRADPSNGIWLCRRCAKLVDSDADSFSVERLHQWKQAHEQWVEAGRPTDESATREISVTDGGTGSLVVNEGSGTALEVIGAPGHAAERIHVRGRGVGEIVTNAGSGTAKVVRSSGARVGLESRVTVSQPVAVAAGLISTMAIVVCERCQLQFQASKVVQGFAGDAVPKALVKCPNCGCDKYI